MHKKKAFMVVLILVVALILFIISQLLWVKYNGKPVAVPITSREPQLMGSGPALRYVVAGDSTAIGQGGSYEQGYAVATAAHMAKNHQVQWVNYAVSGARTQDVFEKQLPQIAAFKPDVVLLAVGANDVTHFTSTATVRNLLAQSLSTLQRDNPDVAIVLTGSPDMGSVPRFSRPVQWWADRRTKAINTTIEALAQGQGAVFAPIARETGALYRAHPELFAVDKFHPTTAGYQPWIPVLITALDAALQQQGQEPTKAE